MRVVMDMQACQSEVSAGRGIGRYATALATSMARDLGDDDLRLCFNSAYSATLRATLATFADAPGRARLSGYATLPLPGASDQREAALRATQTLVRHHWMSLGPDVIHVAHVFEGFDGRAVAPGPLPEVPGLVRSATLYDLIPRLFPDRYLADGARKTWYERQCDLLRGCDCVLAISEASRRDAIEHLGLDPAHVAAIHGGVEPHFQARKPPPDALARLGRRYGICRRSVLYTGGDDYRKNLEGAIAGYSALPARLRADTQLVIACALSPSTRASLIAAAKRRGLPDDALVLTGYVPEADLAALYASCAAFVFPSLYEGLGLPVLEAMASGAPVIGADNSGVAEVVGRNDALFDARSADAMAGRLAAVLDDDGFAGALRRHGVERAAGYTWKRTAALAWQALREAQARARPRVAVSVIARDSRPRLALFTPLPPCRTGIANYNAEFLPHLEPHFAIDVFIDDYEPDAALKARYRILSHRDFASRRRSYDAILYEVGNSEFHAYMLDAVGRYPGVVMLHDAYESGLYGYVDFQLGRRGSYRDALLYAHGPRARRRIAPVQKNPDPVRASMVDLPVSKALIDAAIGVLSHTPFNLGVARTNYPEGWRAPYRIIPHLRRLPAMADAAERAAMRARLGLAADDFLVCTFGHITWTKSGDALLQAFVRSPLACDPRARLVYVGELGRDAFGLEIARAIEASPVRERIRVTGYASEQDYAAYLGVADVAVQLRTQTRGGTSGAVLDCLARAVPVILNESGSFSDYPKEVVRGVGAEVNVTELASALGELHADPEARAAFGKAGRNYVARVHDPDAIAIEYANAIEDFTARARACSLVRTVGELAQSVPAATKDADAFETASIYAAALHQTLAQNTFERQRILVDVSHISDRDQQTGIQRVVRNIVRWLYCSERAGFEPIAVRFLDGALVEATEWLRGEGLVDTSERSRGRTEHRWGDTLLMLDSSWSKIDAMQPVFEAVRRAFGTIITVVYDILPVRFPDAFIDGGAEWFTAWLDKALAASDGCICISAAVVDELSSYADIRGVRLPPRLGVMHLGADLRIEPDKMASARVRQATALRTLLMVGTLEPRKNHALALDAFERLWAQGVDVALCIAGKPGWSVTHLTERLRRHPENRRRLFVIDDPDDDELAALYHGCAGMLLASRGEGFGLPLIEAAQFGLPILASDIPVFREIAGDHATYFQLGTAEQLASVLESWLATPSGSVPQSANMPRLSWEQSAEQLLDIVLANRWYKLRHDEREQ
ncbi:MAG: glycosyltransferase [Casimicrobiaceae bacterium]